MRVSLSTVALAAVACVLTAGPAAAQEQEREGEILVT
jgi:hypothetical protein